jgi:16S rRNA (uracil1498-N3)-methyltransferase
MPNYDFRSPRLYVEASLGEGTEVALNASQSHYLGTVLRLKPGSRVLVFNGRDGEWAASFTAAKRTSALFVSDQTRPQSPATDLHYVFAPIKAARLDYMVQKAVEMGVSQLQPVFTRHSQVARVNTERMRANAIEAAEQCGILCLPEIAEPVAFSQLLAQWDRREGSYFAMRMPRQSIRLRGWRTCRVCRLRFSSGRRGDSPRTNARLC